MKYKLILLILLQLIMVYLNSCSNNINDSSNKTLAIGPVNIIPMDENRILNNQIILINNGIIQSFGSIDNIPIPKNAEYINGANKYLMPGFLDLHVHME